MKYTVKLYPRAYRDLDEIYSYIAVNLAEPDTAEKMVNALENTIFSLEQFPERGSIRRSGAYANQDYRQLFVRMRGVDPEPPIMSYFQSFSAYRRSQPVRVTPPLHRKIRENNLILGAKQFLASRFSSDRGKTTANP